MKAGTARWSWPGRMGDGVPELRTSLILVSYSFGPQSGIRSRHGGLGTKKATGMLESAP